MMMMQLSGRLPPGDAAAAAVHDLAVDSALPRQGPRQGPRPGPRPGRRLHLEVGPVAAELQHPIRQCPTPAHDGEGLSLLPFHRQTWAVQLLAAVWAILIESIPIPIPAVVQAAGGRLTTVAVAGIAALPWQLQVLLVSVEALSWAQ